MNDTKDPMGEKPREWYGILDPRINQITKTFLDKKSRDQWLDGYYWNNKDSRKPIHVIEYSAYTALQARFKEVFGPAGFKSVSNLMDERDLWKERVDREQNLTDEFRIERDTLATENAKLKADLEIALEFSSRVYCLTENSFNKQFANMNEINAICSEALSKLSSRKDGGT